MKGTFTQDILKGWLLEEVDSIARNILNRRYFTWYSRPPKNLSELRYQIELRLRNKHGNLLDHTTIENILRLALLEYLQKFQWILDRNEKCTQKFLAKIELASILFPKKIREAICGDLCELSDRYVKAGVPVWRIKASLLIKVFINACWSLRFVVSNYINNKKRKR